MFAPLRRVVRRINVRRGKMDLKGGGVEIIEMHTIYSLNSM